MAFSQCLGTYEDLMKLDWQGRLIASENKQGAEFVEEEVVVE